MKSKRAMYILGGLSVLSVLSLALLWGTLVGAAPASAVNGVITVSPGAVSPSASLVVTGDRRVTITVSDSDLDTVGFVGIGPNKEPFSFDQVSGLTNAGAATNAPPAGNGERVAILTNSPNPFTIFLRANPIERKAGTTGNVIGTDVFTPIGDRNGDGFVNASDIALVFPSGSGVVAADIGTVSIIDPSRGLVSFSVLSNNLLDKIFDVRYATPTQQLTRAPKTFSETIKVTAITGATETATGDEPFKITLTNTLPSGEKVVTTGDPVYVTATTAAGVSIGSFKAKINTTLSVGSTFSAIYSGDDVLSTGSVVAGVVFVMPLSITLLDTGDGSDGIVSGDDLTKIAGNVTVVSATSSTVTLKATAPLATGETIKLRYRGQETLTVPQTGIGKGEVFTIDLKAAWLPVLDTGDGNITTHDVVATVASVSGATLTVTSLGGAATIANTADGSAGGNTITLTHTGDAVPVTASIKVTYRGFEDLVTVKGSNGTELALRLRETGASTGVFTGYIVGVDGNAHTVDGSFNHLDPTKTGDAEVAQIAILPGTNITVSYSDKSSAAGGTQKITTQVNVDPEPPSFTNVTPSTGSVTNDLDSVLSTEIFDSVAQVNSAKDSSIVLNVKVGSDDAFDVTSGDITVAETVAGTGVFKVSFEIKKLQLVKDAIANSTDIDPTDIVWKISAKDKAGNLGSTGAQKLTIIKRSPKLDSAITGNTFNTTTKAVVTARSTASVDKRTSIQLTFNVPLKKATVDASDFTVDGVPPTGADHFSESPTSVFLTVLALGPDAKPVVAIVGEIEDSGGNKLSSGNATASDGISPVVTASFTGGANYTKANIELAISSDEAIAGALPIIKVFRCNDKDGSTTACTADQTITPSTVVVTSQKAWTTSIKSFAEGRYTVQINVRDGAGNLATVGGTDNSAKGALSFEIDKSMPRPLGVPGVGTCCNAGGTGSLDTKPLNGATIALAEPVLIEIHWFNESNEYTGDSHKKVTLTKVELDGKDISSLVSSRDNITFTVAIPKATLGATSADQLKEHKLVFAGQDEGGNKLAADETLTFTVTKRAAYQIPLSVGVNLISLPAEPEATDINKVITTADNVNLVFTYDASDPKGPWLVASRQDVTQPFQGDLTNIDAKHAYFVRAISDDTLDVDIPLPDPLKLFIPPTISVQKGWNLIPVSDITQQSFDTEVAHYATGFTRALTYNPAVSQPWTKAATFKTGRGYWVWFDTAGLIIP